MKYNLLQFVKGIFIGSGAILPRNKQWRVLRYFWNL